MEQKEKREVNRIRFFLALLVSVELIFVIFLTVSSLQIVFAGVGQNVSSIFRMDIGNSAPEVVNITIYADSENSIDLVQNSTKQIIVESIVRDYNGESDISAVKLEFYDNQLSFFGGSDDNNYHYTNQSCYIDYSYGDSILANATCTLDLLYYANNATWNATIYVNDTNTLFNTDNRQITINKLLAFGLPEFIDYGTVNATNVSLEQVANVTNFGNVRVNLTLEGYAVNRSDGWAMNCTSGTVKNISVYYEKYNLTSSNTGELSLTQFSALYTNLSSVSTVKKFNLNNRQNEAFNEAVNATYWRLYVPKGVAGSCSGNIIFGATIATGS